MTLAQGDPFVVGDIFSFQQANRIKDSWRAAAAPSNPQAGSLWSDSVNEKLFHRQASAYMEIIQSDNFYLSTIADGGFCLRIDAYQDDVTALTGLLRGAYIQASNGALVATGIIRALELKARAGRPGETGNDVAILEGLSISADAKVYDITTVMRGAEIILDGASGASIVKAVGIRIAQNFQADIATLCYGLEIYRDSFDYDADIALSNGGLIGGTTGHLRITDDGNVSIPIGSLTIDTAFDPILDLQSSSATVLAISNAGVIDYKQTSDAVNINFIFHKQVFQFQSAYTGPVAYTGFCLQASDGKGGMIEAYADAGDEGGWSPSIRLVADYANTIAYIISDVAIDFRVSNDIDDYIQFKTSSHVPEITTIGACDLLISSSNGVILSQSGGKLGFYGLATPITKPTGVAVTAAGIHAALVSLGLIAA